MLKESVHTSAEARHEARMTKGMLRIMAWSKGDGQAPWTLEDLAIAGDR